MTLFSHKIRSVRCNRGKNANANVYVQIRKKYDAAVLSFRPESDDKRRNIFFGTQAFILP